jgi:NAD(P)-dependent dehydrogenase (short-subunit alcohol dehydrogenase family)
MVCKDKVVLVTGAAGDGIGRSIALALAREGADITDRKQCQALIEAGTEEFSRIDICIIGPGGGCGVL